MSNIDSDVGKKQPSTLMCLIMPVSDSVGIYMRL